MADLKAIRERNAVCATDGDRDRKHLDRAALLGLLDECRSTLAECAEYFDRHVDVVDGPEGQPVANGAMRLHTEVEALLAKLEGDK